MEKFQVQTKIRSPLEDPRIYTGIIYKVVIFCDFIQENCNRHFNRRLLAIELRTRTLLARHLEHIFLKVLFVQNK